MEEEEVRGKSWYLALIAGEYRDAIVKSFIGFVRLKRASVLLPYASLSLSLVF